MNKKNLSKLTLCILLMITVFSFIPVVNVKAGAPAYMWKKPGWTTDTGNRIWNWWFPWIGTDGHVYIDHDDWSFFRVGWAVSDYEIEMGYDPGPPYQMKLFIDGEEIVMKRFAYAYKDLSLFPNGELRTAHIRVWMWHVRFEPGYFEKDVTYVIREVFLVRKPYQTDDSNKWRTYVNHMSGGGPPGAPYTWEDWYGPVDLGNDQITYLHPIEF
ncbi:MAG: hypothetical protein ACFFE4_22840 [Candidatus Thorarchaeota archaeon]